MIKTPQSIAERSHQPAWARLVRCVGILLLAPGALAAQNAARTISADTDFLKELGGPTVLARLPKGSMVLAGSTKNGWAEVTLTGWMASSALRDEKRDGFDVSVSTLAGSPVRAEAGGGATLATAKAGALFHRVATKGAWVQVRRTGWIAADRLAAPANGVTAPSSPAAVKIDSPVGTPKAPGAAGTGLPEGMLAIGSALFAQPSGNQIAVTELPFTGRVTERKNGWTRVQLDLWVRDEALAAPGTVPSGGVTAAALRADPDKYNGQSVEWTLQVLALQKADELRPEIPLGQPYLLARGPLPEAGLVYLMIPPAELERFAALEPLAKIKVLATVRSGRARHLPTPVLEFVRRLN